jgi:hypothetical protein
VLTLVIPESKSATDLNVCGSIGRCQNRQALKSARNEWLLQVIPGYLRNTSFSARNTSRNSRSEVCWPLDGDRAPPTARVTNLASRQCSKASMCKMRGHDACHEVPVRLSVTAN